MTEQTPVQSLAVQGITQAITIAIDNIGIPHIRAENTSDAFFGQGYAAAELRLFQMEMWLRRGTGRLSEVLGDTLLEQDSAARLFMYKGNIEDVWKAYGNADVKNSVESFVAGINAFIETTRQNRTLLPPEYSALDIEPCPWSAEQLMRIRSHARTENLEKELSRALLIRDFGYKVEQLLYPHEDNTRSVVLDPDIPWDAIDDSALDLWRLSKADVELPTGVYINGSSPHEGEQRQTNLSVNDDSDLGGSNNWIVGGALTVSGRPLLAHDPHRRMSIPALRMVAHLTCPQFNVIGAAEPIMPGISVGHNDYLAFSLTIHPSDNEDLFISRLNPENSQQYWYQGVWENIFTIKEVIHIKGKPDRTTRLAYTRYGPVTKIDTNAGYLASVKSTTLEPGGVAYLSCLNYLGARTAEEYHDALASWVVPITNHLYVDTNRHAQWQVAGLIPERPDESGAVPTIGDGSRDWQGFRLFAHNPHHDIGNDEFFTTSNEYNLWSNDDGYAGYEGMDWPTADRHQRITELLQNNNHWTIESTQKAQNDILSIPAREICKILHELWIGVSTHIERQPTTSRDAYTALNLLRVWNGHMDAERSEPLIFEIWSQHHLYPCLLKRHLKNLLPSDQQEAALPRILELSNYHCDSRILRTLFGNLAQSPDARAIIITTLSSAVADLKERYGPNMRTWRWGQFHVSKLSHMLNGHTSATWDELPAHELSGDFSTVALGAYTPDGIHSVGAGWRTIIDVGNWDNSLQILMPGQSGDPRNQHYDDQSESWYTGGYTAMPFSEQQIASAVKHQTILTPRKP